jgi:DNA adenine methylase
LKPIIKWPGGKRALVERIAGLLPPTWGDYYEPFFGGGALFFALDPTRYDRAFLSDANAELAGLYAAVRDDLEAVRAALQRLQPDQVTRDAYNAVRAWRPTKPADRAARTLYLNHLCFNGLYRVNKAGEFNTSWGKKTSWTPDYDGLRDASRALARARFSCGDFAEAVAGAKRGDVVYLDPPYVPVSATANFVAYTADGFGIADHVRVATTFEVLASRGVVVIASNADTPAVRALYGAIEGARFVEVKMNRTINCKADGKGPVGELLIAANVAMNAEAA